MPLFSGQSEEVTQNFELNARQGQQDLSFFTEIFCPRTQFLNEIWIQEKSVKRHWKMSYQLLFTKMAVKQLGQSPVQMALAFHFIYDKRFTSSPTR